MREVEHLQTTELTEDNQSAILRMFPEARTEGGKIDFDRLKLALGEEVDVGKERFAISWPGRSDCFRVIQTPSLGTLLPRSDQSKIEFETTGNVIVEGDNLRCRKFWRRVIWERSK